MARDIPVGNGNLLVAFDERYRIREFFFPCVGQSNHTSGHPFRFGVWVDGRLSWVDEPSWNRELTYESNTLVTSVHLEHAELGISLLCHDCVDFDVNVYLRRILIRNLQDSPRDVRLFFHQDFDVGGSRDGDTAYYHPTERAMIHYKGRHWFLISANTEKVWGLSSFATGITGHHGSEGTWRDAEDGALSRNPIAQGQVDSTVCLKVPLDRQATVHYWIGAGQDQAEAFRVNRFVRETGPETILGRVRAYWRQWVAHDRAHFGLPDDVRSFYRRCLLILRTQIDNRGAILAANDSDALDYNRDSYSYLWPRDGALVAQALDLAGYHDVAERFFSFCARLMGPEGYFMHKYNPDGSVGSSWHPWCAPDGVLQLPIQEDETALVLHALWEHYSAIRDIDFVRTIYRSLIEPAGDFLCSYRNRGIGLPEPTWDLWEERRGVHLFTVASVWAGLAAAANFAEIFGDGGRADRYSRAAAEIREAAAEHMVDPDQERFVRALIPAGKEWRKDLTLDSSMAGLFLFGMFEADDPRVIRTMEAVADRLWCRSGVGGMARYEGDGYYRMPGCEGIPGNPWFLCTLWLAQWHIERASSPAELERPMDLMRWVIAHALPSGVLAEQLHPHSGSPLSVSPLTWSHATFVTTVCKWEEKYRRLTDRRLK